MQRFDFEVQHHSGSKNPADGPSRRPDYDTKEELPVDNILTLAATQVPVALKEDLIEALTTDPLVMTLTEDLLNPLQEQ